MTYNILHTICPSCKGDQIEGFFKIKSVPIFSMVTIRSKEEALSVPRKDIELGFCHNCGFIFNRLFDTSINYFNLGYEDQQGFSTTFMQYLTRISTELIEKYNLTGKTVLEIGCGKGDFIHLFNGLAGGKGIGIDPTYEMGRQTNPNLSFFKEVYSAKHGKIGADLICCRHTLEHIYETQDFLNLIRTSLNDRPSTIVFFEIPQINRILDTCAFWDIYYEHCSYFSAGSLARLFTTAGYEIMDIRLGYGEQYLLIEAKAATKPCVKTFEIQERIDDQKVRIEKFQKAINKQLCKWREHLLMMKNSGKKTVVWGGGSKSVGFLSNFIDLDFIEYVVDINPNMENNYIPGIGCRYVQPFFLKEYQPDIVIIMNGVYQKEILKTMNSIGVFPEIVIL